MMLTTVIQGAPELETRLTLLTTELDPVRLLDQAAAILLNRIRTRYLQQVDSAGAPWLQSEAAKIRASKGVGGGTLFDTGTLFRSIQLYAEGPTSRAIGTDVPYGIFHNFGTPLLPIREFLAFGESDLGVVQQFLTQNYARALV